ncbi:hypothetical protein [Dyadobacter sp. CY347]|uniref:hypothetical protein n=1 Tax=Dyadobacter sp. CY347 TaxID=2909336 RepID=UPI001F453A6A|nr:hypothetical protein [Dyadobacter sp. CY347]MCF2490730.1 hypothetical protein [Dyadobacter sp. CY347]
MKNEDLSCKIRALLDTSDKSDPDWDPDKFWDRFEARKKRQQRWVVLSYSMAAMVIFGILSIVVTGDGMNGYFGTKPRVSSISQTKNIDPTLKLETRRPLRRDAETPVQHSVFKPNIKQNVSHVASSNSNKPLTEPSEVFAKKRGNSFRQVSYGNDLLFGQSIPVSDEEHNELPSLLEMFEQAKKERELRNQSVQLQDPANFRSFWLTVNQHVLASKLSSDQLHYERY